METVEIPIGPTGTPMPQKQMAQRIFVKADLLANYFNNIKKCWEPLLERLSFSVLSEESPLRGYGLAIRANTPIHLNLSADFLVAIQDTVTMVWDTKMKRQEKAQGQGPKRETREASDNSEHSDQRTFTEEVVLDRIVSTYPTSSAQLEVRPPTTGHRRDTSVGASFYVDKLAHTRVSSKEWLNNLDAPTSYNPLSSAFNPSAMMMMNVPRHLSTLVSSGYAADIKHVFSAPLKDDTKVGFSIENLTGQSLRYLQRWENGRKTIQYLEHGQRGLLNFLASTTVLRNNKPHTVQLDDTDTDTNGRGGEGKSFGKHLALQIAGYKWLPSVSVDKLGVKFQELKPLPGRADVASVYFGTEYLPTGQQGERPAMANALRLIAEVHKYTLLLTWQTF